MSSYGNSTSLRDRKGPLPIDSSMNFAHIFRISNMARLLWRFSMHSLRPIVIVFFLYYQSLFRPFASMCDLFRDKWKACLVKTYIMANTFFSNYLTPHFLFSVLSMCIPFCETPPNHFHWLKNSSNMTIFCDT